MSEGDPPYKRQRLSEGQEMISVEDSNLKYQNACLSSRLKDQRKEISDLISKNEELSSKVQSLEETLLNFNCNWAKVIFIQTISDINTLCAELCVRPDIQNPFEIFIYESAGMEKLNEITKKCISKLLETIEKVNDFESGAIVENCKPELQTNEIMAENMKLKVEAKKNREELNRLQGLVNGLNEEKANLSIRLAKRGDYKNSESKTEEKINENIEEIKSDRDTYKAMYLEETKKNARNKFQHEISNEKVIQSRAFKSLIHQAKALKKKLESYKERNHSLYKYKEEFKDTLRKECHLIMKKEEDKRESLYSEIKSLQSRLANSEKEKSELGMALENVKSSNNHHKNSENWKELIEILTKDKNDLKGQNNELKQKLLESDRKNEELLSMTCSNSHDSESQKFQKIIEDLKQKLKSEHSTVETLITEIELTGNAYENLVEKTKSLTLQLTDQEKLYNKLMNEKVKESSWRAVHDQEIKAYENKIKSLEDIISSNEFLIKECENQLKTKSDLLNSLEAKNREIENKIRNIIESNEENLMKYHEIVEYKKDYVSSLKKSEDLVSTLTQEKHELLMKIEEYKKEINALEIKLRNEQNQDNVKSADEVLNAEVAGYRKMIRCSVCCTRIKSIILSKCLHTFCKECLDDSLAVRKRKCPFCKIRFSSEDMKTFWWDRS